MSEIPTFNEALERFIEIFRRGESSIAGIRAELAMIRNDSMLPINRDKLDAIAAQLIVAELALDALGTQCNELWKVQRAKEKQS